MATRARPIDRVYVSWIVGAAILVLLAGFGRSFFFAPLFDEAPEWAATEPVFYLHGFVFTGWFALLAAQTWLIRAQRVGAHRTLGAWGAVLGVGIVLLGVYSALKAANRPGGFIGVPVPPEQFLIVPLSGVVLFALFLALAIRWRSDAARHKRLILFASISLLGAAIARITLLLPVLPLWTDAVIFASFTAAIAAWDFRVYRRVRTDTMFGGGALIGLTLAALPLAQTAAWQSLARGMMGLVGPP